MWRTNLQEGLGLPVSSDRELADASAIGRLRTVVGAVAITRAGAIIAQPAVDDLVYRGDLIETGGDGFITIAFADGTAFQLGAGARAALDEFTYGAGISANAARFRILKGVFGFVAGKVASAAGLTIDTPTARIRNVAGTAGFGSLALGILSIGLVHDLQAANVDIALLDDGTIDYKDLRHGVFEIITKEDHPRHIIVDDPGVTIVLRPHGAGIVGVEQVANSLAQMAQLQSDFQSTLSTFFQGQEDPLIHQLQQGPNPDEHANAQPQAIFGSTGSTTPPEIVNNTGTELFQPAANNNPSPTVAVVGNAASVPETGGGGTATTTLSSVTTQQVVTESTETAIVQWISQTNDAWSTPTAWSDSIVPNAGNVVQILVPVTITLNDAESAGALVIGAGATLMITSGGALTIFSGISGAGVVVLDDPTVYVNSTTTTTLSTTLSGGGTLEMIGPTADNLIISASGTSSTLVVADYTIEGSGEIGQGDGALTFVNGGTVDATPLASGDSGLLIIHTGTSVTNTDLLEATAGGTLELGDSVDNAGGTLAAHGAGSAVQLSDSTVSGGMLVTDDLTSGSGGTIEVIVASGANMSVFDGSAGALTVDGYVEVNAGAGLELLGTIDNLGIISVASGATATNLLVGGSVTLADGGAVTLSGSSAAIIGAAGGGTLDNVDNAITGAGAIGNDGVDALSLDNETAASIDANISGETLTIHTGREINNAGLLEATNGGTLAIDDSLANSGTLAANGGIVDAAAAVTGSGSATISDGGTLELGATDAQTVTFEDTGTLKLDGGSDFTGTIAGLAAGDVIDLADTIVSSVVWNGSTLTVNGAPTTFTISGLPSGDTFAFKSDGGTGTDLVVVPQVVSITASPVTGVEDSAIPLDLTVTLGDATLTSFVLSGIPSGATLSDADGDTLTVSGGSISFDAAQLADGVLNGLAITPANDANFTLSVSATATDANGDEYSMTASESVTVDPAPPAVTPVAVAGGAGQPIALELGISPTNQSGDSNTIDTVTLTFTVPTGASYTFTGAGLNETFTAGADQTLTLTPAQLVGLSITTSTPGVISLTVAATEQDAEGDVSTSATGTETVTVNGLPVITAPASVTIGVGQTTLITGISLTESGSTAGETFTLTLSDTTGTLAATGGIWNSATDTLTISNVSLSQANTDLASLTDTDTTTGSDTITLGVTDSLGNSALQQTIAVTVTSVVEWINTAGGTWTDATNADVNWSTGSVPNSLDTVLVNASGAAAYTVTIPSGEVATAASLTVSSSNATVLDQGTLTLTGTLEVDAGTFELSGAGTLSNFGALVLTGGAIELASESLTVGSFLQSGGTLSGAGTLTVSGLSTINGGTETGGGTTLAAGGASFFAAADETLTLDNYTLELEGSSQTDGLAGDAIDLNNGAQLVIDSGATFTVQTTSFDIASTAGTGNEVVNLGTLAASGGGDLVVEDLLDNQGGTVSIDDGTVTLDAVNGDLPVNFSGTGGMLMLDGTVNGGAAAGIDATATGAAAMTIELADTGSVTSTGADGIDASAAGGDIAITADGPVTGAGNGIDATQNGNGNITVNVGSDATITGTALYGIGIFSLGSGDLSVETASGATIDSGSAGIVAVNEATAIAESASDTIVSNITVTASGTIDSGATETSNGEPPAGILAGYKGGTTDTQNGAVFGDVIVTNYADITATAGDGIRAFNFGAGNVTVDDDAGTITTDGDAVVGQTSTPNPPDGYANGIYAYDDGSGDITVMMAAAASITSAASGIFASNTATSVPSTSFISVTADGTINSGTIPSPSGNPPAGILAGYNSDGSPEADVAGSVDVTNYANITAAAGNGIEAYNYGTGDVTVTDEADTTIQTTGPKGQYGIDAFSDDGQGSVSVTTSAGDTISANGAGIIAEDDATSIPSDADSTIIVTAYGTINSGTHLTQGGNSPAGILAGYYPTAAEPDTDATGSVTVNNFANITAAAGAGIDAYNWDNGDVTVNDNYGVDAVASTTVGGATFGIEATALSGGIGNVAVDLGADATVSTAAAASGGLFGIYAFSLDTGNVTVTMATGDVITSGSDGVVAIDAAAAILSSADSSITVTAAGTINSGSNLADDGPPGGIVAGYYPNNTAEADANVSGNVDVTSDATITAAGEWGIYAFNFGTGDATVSTAADSSITVESADDATPIGISAAAFDGGDASITNDGTVSVAAGIALQAQAVTPDDSGSGTVTIINCGTVTGAGTSASPVVQIFTDDGGSAMLTNTTSGIIAPISFSTCGEAVADANAITIDNYGTIVGNVALSNPTVANDTTLTNESTGVWDVSGYNDFGSGTDTIDNAGTIDIAASGIEVDGNDVTSPANSSTSFSADGTLTFENESTGVVTINGTTLLSGAVTISGTDSSEDAVSVISVTINSDSGPDVVIGGAVTGTGTFDIPVGGTLEFSSTDTATVTFNGEISTLQFDDAVPGSFTGEIQGLVIGDIIDLRNVAPDSIASTMISDDGSELIVTETTSGTILTYDIAPASGSLAGDYFNPETDNHGGTDLVLEVAPSTANDVPETVDGIDGDYVSDNVFNYDSFPEGASLAVTAVAAATETDGVFTADGTFGEIVVNATTGDFTYTVGVTPDQAAAVAALGANTPIDSFSYTVGDGTNTAQATIDITVIGETATNGSTPDVWTGADADDPGDWNDAENWTAGVPGPTSDVLLDLAASITVIVLSDACSNHLLEYGAGLLDIAADVTLTAGADSYVTNLTLEQGATLDLSAGNLTIAGALAMDPDSIIALSAGSLTIDSIAADLAILALCGNGAFIGTNAGSVNVGPIGGNLSVVDAAADGYGLALLYAFSGSVTINSVGGNVTVSASGNNSDAAIYADQVLTIGTADADAIVGDLCVSACGSDSTAHLSAGDAVSISAIGGYLTVSASDGANAYVQAGDGDLSIGAIGGDLTITDTDDNGCGYAAIIAQCDGSVSIGTIADSLYIEAGCDATADISAAINVTIGAVEGCFTLSADDSEAYVQANDGYVILGGIGDDLTVDASADGSAWIYALDDGSISIAAVTGNVTLSADNDGYYAEIYADQDVTFGSADGPAIGGSLIVCANCDSGAYLDPYGNLTIAGIGQNLTISAAGDGSYADVQSYDGNITTGDIGGSVSISGTDGGQAYLSTEGANDITLGAIGGSLSVSTDGSEGSSAEILAGNNLTIGAITGSVSISGTGEIASENGNITFGAVGGDFSNAGTIATGVDCGTPGVISFGPVEGVFTNTGLIQASQINIFGAPGAGETFDNEGTVSGALVLLDSNAEIGSDATQNGTIVFATDGETVTIDIPTNPSGDPPIYETIADFVSNQDAINLVGVIYCSEGMTETVSTGGTLQIEDSAGDTAYINLEGNYQVSDFVLSPYENSQGDVIGTTVTLVDSEWTAGDGDFGTAANWSSGEVPGASDYVAIRASGAVVTLDSGCSDTIAGLVIGSPAELDVCGSLQVGGAVINAGTIAVNADATFAAQGDLTNEGLFTVYNADSFCVGGDIYNLGGTLAVVSDPCDTLAGPPAAVDGGAIIVLATASGDAELNPGGYLLSADIAELCVSATGSADAGSYASLDPSGYLTIGDISGAFTVTAADYGTAYVSPCGELTTGNITGDFNLSASSDSEVGVDPGADATIGDIGGAFIICASTLSEVDFDPEGALTVGNIVGSLSLSAGADSAIYVQPDGTLSTGDIGGNLMLCADDSTIYFGPDSYGSALTTGNIAGCLLVSAVDGTVNSASSYFEAYYGDVTVGAIGGGLTVSSTGDTAEAQIYAGDDLAIESVGGSLTISADGGSGSFFITGIDAGGSLLIGAIAYNLTVSATGDGNAALQSEEGGITIGDIGGGVTVCADGSYATFASEGGNLTIGDISGNLLVSATNCGDASFGAGGDLAIAAIGGSFTLYTDGSDGAFVDVGADENVTIGTIAGNVSLSVDAELASSYGDLSFAAIGGSFCNAGEIDAGGIFSVTGPIGGSFVNAATGLIEAGEIDISATVGQTFVNAGTVEICGPDTSTIAVAVDNACGGSIDIGNCAGLVVDGALTDDGTITIGNGADLVADGALAGSGTITIGCDANLTVEGAAATSTGTIAFDGSGAVLTLYESALNASLAFTPILCGFTDGDAIDYEGIVTSAVYTSTGVDTGTLTLYDGTTVVATLTLDGDYSGDTFTTTAIDGGTVTEIVDPPAASTTASVIAAGASLDINAPSAASVSFAGGTGELVLGQAETFSGQISGFTGTAPDAAHSDAIDLVGFDYASTTFSETSSNGNLVLTATDGDNVATLTFDDFDGTLHFASDGDGGTLITDPPATDSSTTPITNPPMTNSSATSVSLGSDNFIFRHDLGGVSGAVDPAVGTPEFDRPFAAEMHDWLASNEQNSEAFVDFAHHLHDGGVSSALWHGLVQSAVHLH